MIATKDQERKALEKIKKIISDLGENSYLKMAFDGCFEIAESNIDNDFGDSPRENMECAEKEIRECKNKIEQLSCENEVLNNKLVMAERHVISDKSLEIAVEALRKVRGDYLEEVIKLKNTIVENAETPDTDTFKNAVKRHRFLSNECDDYLKAMEEIQIVREL